MANTYYKICIHIVFAVQGSTNNIQEEFRNPLQKYIAGIVRNAKQKLYAIYCMPDHTHLLVSISPTIVISDLVRDIKANSSRFIKEQKWLATRFAWQEGFGAFSCGHRDLDTLTQFILNQPEHHHETSFKDEFLKLLKIHNLAYEERYLFEFEPYMHRRSN